MEMKLCTLDCHSNWHLLDSETRDEKEICLVTYLKTDVLMNPDIEIQALTFMGYLLAELEEKFVEALDVLDEALNKCKEKRPSHADGFKMVALANKIFILAKKECNKQQVQSLLNEIRQLQPLSNVSRAGVFGVRAYALSMLGKTRYAEGMGYYQKALRLDKTHFDWPLGLAILAGRLRRIEEGNQPHPTELEEANIALAIKLSDGKNPLPLAFMGDLLFNKGRHFNGVEKDYELLEKSKEFYMRALDLAPKCTHVLKRCGKAFSIMDEVDLAEKCLLMAVELDPDNSVVLHRLAQLYEHTIKNYALARAYCEKAVTSRKDRNLFAELDLARIKKKMDVRYNLIAHFEAMKDGYKNDKKSLDHIDVAIQRQKDYEAKSYERKVQNRGGQPRAPGTNRGRGGRNYVDRSCGARQHGQTFDSRRPSQYRRPPRDDGRDQALRHVQDAFAPQDGQRVQQSSPFCTDHVKASTSRLGDILTSRERSVISG